MQIYEESLIAKLLTMVPKVYGQKALQKLVYLYQEIGGFDVQEYDFMWSHHSPYSVELAKDLQFLASTGDVSVTGKFNEIQATARVKLKLSQSEKAALSKLVELKGKLQPSQLELLASIEYAIKRGGLPNEREIIFNYVETVKPGRFSRRRSVGMGDGAERRRDRRYCKTRWQGRADFRWRSG